MSLNLKIIDYNDKILLEKILIWRNDIITRKYSLNENIITNEIFNIIISKYKESVIQPRIIYFENLQIGIFSFVNNNGKIYVGINIDSNYRGKNIASQCLKLLLSEFEKNNLNEKIYAQIKKNNISSIKLFEKYFNFISENDNYYEYMY